MFVETMPDDVTWFSSSQQGAPQMMGGSNGDMLKVLDACMIDGFGEAEATSVTKDLDETTIDFGVGHGYLSRQKVLISGAEDPLLNGTHKIRSLTATSITIYTPAVTSIAGTIVVKVAPLGWESIFGKTDPLKRAYRSLSPTSAKKVLYLDMTYPSAAGYHASSPAKRAIVSVCQDMQVLGEQIGSMLDSYHRYDLGVKGALFWYQKRGSSASTAVPSTVTNWKIVGNANFFYFLIGWGSSAGFDSTNYCDVFGFGEYIGLYDDPSDKTFLMAAYNHQDDSAMNVGTIGANIWTSAFRASIGAYFSSSDGKMAYENLSVIGSPSTTNLTSSRGYIKYPNAKGNALFTMPLRAAKSDAEVINGMMPSIAYIENKIDSTTYDATITDDILLAQVQGANSVSPTACYFGFYVGD